jgi:hypothetical protein
MKGMRSKLFTQALHLSLLVQCYFLEPALYDFTSLGAYNAL